MILTEPLKGMKSCHLHSVIQSEISQERDKYCLLTHIWGVLKEGTGETICKAEIETGMENKHINTKGRREG